MSTFRSDTFQNEYLPAGGTEVNAIVTVTASDGDGGPTPVRQAAEIIIIDVSGSMGEPSRKLQAAKEATIAAIDCIRDGVLFGVIAGNEYGHLIYPEAEEFIEASELSRATARDRVEDLMAGGGTAIGNWLAVANDLFAQDEAGIKHAILLTDGRDESETPRQFAAVLAECEGKFQCDCRGVGTDWEVKELRKIASTLLGSVDIVAEPRDLASDFQAMMRWAMGKQVNDVALRLWVPKGAEVRFVKQVSPTIEDLTGRLHQVSEMENDYPTGAWGNESRDYHVCIGVPARSVGDEMLAGRIKLVVDGEIVSQALIRAVWTDDVALSTRISREVAHYTGEAELAEAIQEGLEARRVGDLERATTKLGRAVQLADADGNEATKKLLAGVVEIDEAATGRVRLRRQIDQAEEMALDTRSTKTVRVRGPAS